VLWLADWGWACEGCGGGGWAVAIPAALRPPHPRRFRLKVGGASVSWLRRAGRLVGQARLMQSLLEWSGASGPGE
jgi:hypothetical protein